MTILNFPPYFHCRVGNACSRKPFFSEARRIRIKDYADVKWWLDTFPKKCYSVFPFGIFSVPTTDLNYEYYWGQLRPKQFLIHRKKTKINNTVKCNGDAS
jgi:hypothetical protein